MKELFLTHRKGISEYRIDTVIVYLRPEFGILFLGFLSFSLSFFPPNNDDSNTLHWHHFQFSNSYYIYSILSKGYVWAGGRGVPIHAYLGQSNELNNYVSSTTGSVKYFLLTKLQ